MSSQAAIIDQGRGPTIELRALGALDLRGTGGAHPDAILTHPKRVALLAYLAVARPRGFQRRDLLLALLWPELDDEHARGALNQALHQLRHALGPDVLLSRGAEEVGLAPSRLWCDVAAFDAAESDGRLEQALELYRGELLQGFHVSGSGEFERWLDTERTRLKDAALHAAWVLAEQQEAAGNAVAAGHWARRAAELAADDEVALRRVLELLDRVGDRAGAIRVYDDFARRLHAIEVEPAPETVEVMEALRRRAGATRPPSEPADRFATADEFAVALEAARTAPSGSEGVRLVRVSRRRWAWIGAGALAVAAGVFATVRREPATVYVPGRVVVVPLEVPAGDSALTDFARGLATTLPEAIAREGVAEPVPEATVGDVLAHATGLSGVVAERLARETGAGLELRGRCSGVPGGATCEVEVLRVPAKVLRMSVGATGDPTQPAFKAELTERVLVALELQRRYGDRVTWLGEYMPRSLAALRAFESGWELEWGNDSSPDHYYVEAARLDTAWVLPAAWHVFYNQDTASLKRLTARPGLVAGEREAAEYVLATTRGDPERSFELAQRRFAVNPEWWLYMVTRWAYTTGRANRALAVSGYVDSAVHVPDRALRSAEFIRGFALHQLGRYQDQLRLARDLERRFPDHQVRERTNEVMALAALGEVDSLRRLLTEWAAIPEPEVKGWVGTRAVVAGEELMAHGKEREGRELLATALPLLRRRRRTEGCTCEEVAILGEIGQLDEADRLGRADLQTLKSMADSDSYLGVLGVIAARRGRPEEAAQYDRLLARAQQRPGLTGEILMLRADIASVLGDREEAVRLIEKARARGFFGASHRFAHSDPGFIPLRGYPPFERFLKPRG